MSEAALPPGQRARADFPRFGLWPYAHRAPAADAPPSLLISGDVLLSPATVSWPPADVPRITRTSDFHCVTTWSHLGLQWSGVSFAAFYAAQVEPGLTAGADEPRLVVLRGADGYRTTLPLVDLLADGVMIADQLDGRRLTREHGAPLRLVAPAHYGYKQVKHLTRLEFWRGQPKLRARGFAFIDHPRARTAYEERGPLAPGWLLRHVYRPFIARTVRRFRLGQPHPST
jgi:DMSO/TMAO reductase YedYZ molybdopterin-dependent catalytic subunit